MIITVLKEVNLTIVWTLLNFCIVFVIHLILNSLFSIPTSISRIMTLCDNFYYEISQNNYFFGFIYIYNQNISMIILPTYDSVDLHF